MGVWEANERRPIGLAAVTCPFHPDRPARFEIEGRVLVCADCFVDPEIRTHAAKDWR